MSSTRRRDNRRARNSQPSVGTMVVAAAVAYGTYRLATWAWESWNRLEEDDDALLEPRDVLVPETPNNNHQKWRLRRQRMARCRDEVVNAMNDFLPTLRRTIEDLTETLQDTKALKQLRNSQDEGRRLKEQELWNSIKTKAVTRLIATAYAHTILFLVLTTQVHLMGGKLFQEQAHASEISSSLGGSVASGRMLSYQTSHRIVLTRTYDFFFDEGIALLVQAVERAVDLVIGDWDVTHPSSVNISKELLDKAIQDICKHLEGRAGRSSTRRSRTLLRFLLPPEHGVDSFVQDDLAQSILEETLDILESPVFEDAQRDCLSTTFDMMRDERWSKIFLETDLPQHAASPWGTKALATVLSKLKHTSSSFFEVATIPDEVEFPTSASSLNLYLSTIQRLQTVLELGDVSFN